MSTPVGQHVHWARALRDHPHSGQLRAVLARAAVPAHRAAASAHPSIATRLAEVPVSRRGFLLGSLGVITANSHLRHDPRTSIGAAMTDVGGARSALALTLNADGDTALRILSNLIVRAGRHRPLDLIGFADLVTHWPERTPRQRLQPLIDLQATSDRA
jgi:hypothetical protein